MNSPRKNKIDAYRLNRFSRYQKDDYYASSMSELGMSRGSVQAPLGGAKNSDKRELAQTDA